ncbi:hypothetical protein GUJ93_ZPchr0006g42644 [Zizania palustris]|uniref:Uncharacterized protein n=1 Tax=Zizania palustris TaxID=103762 RepID=A0A8J5TAI5_ZIZPA|nr:hypothetical protein GUJ93_ZPchr0006g42644 [Zizania palustris]
MSCTRFAQQPARPRATRPSSPRCMRNCPRAQHARPALQAQLPARPRELPPPHAATPILRNCLHRTHAVHLVFRHTHARRRVALVAGALLLSLKAVCIHSSQCCGVYGVAGGSGEGSRASGVACPVGDVVQLIRSGEGREGDGSRGSTTAKRCLCGHGFGRAPAFLVEGDDADVETHGDLWWVASIRTETRGGNAMVRMRSDVGSTPQADLAHLLASHDQELRALSAEKMIDSKPFLENGVLEQQRFHNASTAKGVSWDN